MADKRRSGKDIDVQRDKRNPIRTEEKLTLPGEEAVIPPEEGIGGARYDAGHISPLEEAGETKHPSEHGHSADKATERHGRSGNGRASRLAMEASALRRSLEVLSGRLDKLAIDMEKAKLKDYVDLMNRPWTLIWRNWLSGIARGIGIALGFTFFAATIVWILQLLGALNLPIVGDYIAEIVKIVQRQLEIEHY